MDAMLVEPVDSLEEDLELSVPAAKRTKTEASVVDWSELPLEVWKVISSQSASVHPWSLLAVNRRLRRLDRVLNTARLWLPNERCQLYFDYVVGQMLPGFDPVGSNILVDILRRLLQQIHANPLVVLEWLQWARSVRDSVGSRAAEEYCRRATPDSLHDCEEALSTAGATGSLRIAWFAAVRLLDKPSLLQRLLAFLIEQKLASSSTYDLLFDRVLPNDVHPRITFRRFGPGTFSNLRNLVTVVINHPTDCTKHLYDICSLLKYNPLVEGEDDDPDELSTADRIGLSLFPAFIGCLMDLYEEECVSFVALQRVYRGLSQWCADSLRMIEPAYPLLRSADFPGASDTALAVASFLSAWSRGDFYNPIGWLDLALLLTTVEPMQNWPLSWEVAIPLLRLCLSASYNQCVDYSDYTPQPLCTRLTDASVAANLKAWLARLPSPTSVASIWPLCRQSVIEVMRRALVGLPLAALPASFITELWRTNTQPNPLPLPVNTNGVLQLSDQRYIDLVLLASESAEATDALCRWEEYPANRFDCHSAKGPIVNPISIRKLVRKLPDPVDATQPSPDLEERLQRQERLLRLLRSLRLLQPIDRLARSNVWYPLLFPDSVTPRRSRTQKPSIANNKPPRAQTAINRWRAGFDAIVSYLRGSSQPK